MANNPGQQSSLFGGGGGGSLFGGTTVGGGAAASAQKPPDSFSGGLFGKSLFPTKPADGAATGTSTSLFGTKPAESTTSFGAKPSDSGLSFGAKPADAATTSFGAKPTGETSTTLFGGQTDASQSLFGKSSLFPAPAPNKPADAPATGLFSSKPTETGSLFGAPKPADATPVPVINTLKPTDTPAPTQSPAPAAGATASTAAPAASGVTTPATGAAEATTTAAAKATPAADPSKLFTTGVSKPKDAPKVETTETGSLDMSEKIEDILAQWERRLGRQVEEFKKYSRAVSDIDSALFDYVLKLVQVRNEQDDLENKQGELIKAVKKVEAQQRAMMEAIEAMEKKVADRMPKVLPNDPESLEAMASSINKTINEMESEVIDLTREVDQLQVEANPGLGKLMLIVSAHAKALSRASATANRLCSA